MFSCLGIWDCFVPFSSGAALSRLFSRMFLIRLYETASAGMALWHVLSFLAPAGLYIGVKAERKDGHKNLGFPYLSRFPVNDTDLCTRKINEYFMARKMLKLHRSGGSFVYPMVMFQKLCVAVRIRCKLPVFLIVVQKGETRMVPCGFALLKIPHQRIEPVVLDGRAGRENLP